MSRMLPNRIPILCYHRVHTDDEKVAVPPLGEYCGHVTLNTFKQHMGYLAEAGYRAVGYDNLCDWITTGATFPQKVFLIDFDDCRLNVYQNALPIMNEFNFRGTLALVTSMLDGEVPESLKGPHSILEWHHVEEFWKQGWWIASHTRNHPYMDELCEEEGPDSVREELRRPIEDVQKRLGLRLTNFIYPAGRYNDRVEGLVRQHYRSARLWSADAIIREGPVYVEPETDIYHLPSVNISMHLPSEKFRAILEMGE